MVVVGEREAASGAVSVRMLRGDKGRVVAIDELISYAQN